MFRGASARRHAQAIFQIAVEKKALERWKSDLEIIARIMLEPGFYALLENPALHFSKKVELLKEKLANVSPEALNLAFLLVDKGRLRILPDIISEYEKMLDGYYGIEKVEAFTALPLTDTEKEDIKKQLETLLSKKVVLDNKVQGDIIGGLVLKIGDRLIDGSTKTRLKALGKELVGIRR